MEWIHANVRFRCHPQSAKKVSHIDAKISYLRQIAKKHTMRVHPPPHVEAERTHQRYEDDNQPICGDTRP